MATISREQYNNLFGPTVGDRIRLGDTDLYIEIERDLRTMGDEVVYGGGKTLRDGMGLANSLSGDQGSLDLVITNVTILDPKLGVVKADVGIKDGKIVCIGKCDDEAKKIMTQESIWPWYGQLMRRPQTISFLLQIEFWLRHYQVEFLF